MPKGERTIGEPKTRTLSMGCGVQTTACLLKFHHLYDAVIFADTYDEHEETYEYVEKYLKPFCKENNVRWVTVEHLHKVTIPDEMAKRKAPKMYIHGRSCTTHHKIEPIHRWIRKNLHASYKEPCRVDIGISTDEIHRVKGRHPRDPKYIVKGYPLIDAKISRRMCKSIIQDHGWPVPIKSGCVYCPFGGLEQMRLCARRYPELFEKLIQIEEANVRFGKDSYMLWGRSLRSIRDGISGTLDGFINEKVEEANAVCDSGHCFV